MQWIIEPKKIELNEEDTLEIHNIEWVGFTPTMYQEVVEGKRSPQEFGGETIEDLDGDIIGSVVAFLNGNRNDFDVWFDNDGSHYVCLPTAPEREEDELEVYLISDLLSEAELSEDFEAYAVIS